MSDPAAQAASALVLRVSVPTAVSFHDVVKELAAKVAAYLGDPEPHAETVVRTLETVAEKVAPTDPGQNDHDIVFEFRQRDNELLIEARCDGRMSHGRHRLPA